MWRDWQIDFGPAFGLAGTTRVLTASPQVVFRGEKVIATDSGSPAGHGTRISTILVGQRLQRPAGGDTLTAFFSERALGNGIRWDVSDKALTLAVTVIFIQSCTFDCSVFGRCIL